MHAQVEIKPEIAGWQASLKLVFRSRSGRTYIQDYERQGPLFVQRPFYPEGQQVAHVYLLHPPSGIVGGDEINISIYSSNLSHALVTTPAAAKYYKSSGAFAVNSQMLCLEEGASLEWLPQETILFGQSKLETKTKIRLATSSRFIGWESYCLGRLASGDVYSTGSVCLSKVEIDLNDEPALHERLLIQGDTAIMKSTLGLKQFTFMSMLWAYPTNQAILDKVRARTAEINEGLVGVTRIGKLMILRVMSNNLIVIQDVLTQVWQMIRPDIMGFPACNPRIWST